MARASNRSDPDWTRYRLTPDKYTIARRLYEAMSIQVSQQGLDWTPTFRSRWIAFKRRPKESACGIQLNSANIRLWVKMPSKGAQRGHKDPYPHLASRWDNDNHQWEWEVPTLDSIPEVRPLIELGKQYHL